MSKKKLTTKEIDNYFRARYAIMKELTLTQFANKINGADEEKMVFWYDTLSPYSYKFKWGVYTSDSGYEEEGETDEVDYNAELTLEEKKEKVIRYYDGRAFAYLHYYFDNNEGALPYQAELAARRSFENQLEAFKRSVKNSYKPVLPVFSMEKDPNLERYSKFTTKAANVFTSDVGGLSFEGNISVCINVIASFLEFKLVNEHYDETKLEFLLEKFDGMVSQLKHHLRNYAKGYSEKIREKEIALKEELEQRLKSINKKEDLSVKECETNETMHEKGEITKWLNVIHTVLKNYKRIERLQENTSSISGGEGVRLNMLLGELTEILNEMNLDKENEKDLK